MKIHGLCDNFISIDAAKGNCNFSGQPVPFDGEVCGNFAAAPHCLNCVNFNDVATSELGECSGFGVIAWVFPTLRARNCTGYKQVVE